MGAPDERGPVRRGDSSADREGSSERAAAVDESIEPVSSHKQPHERVVRRRERASEFVALVELRDLRTCA